MLYAFRKHTQFFLRAIANRINHPLLTPNRLTLLSLPCALVAAYFIAQESYLPAILFVALAFLIDAVDGSLAAVQNRKTLLGNYLDAVVDRFVESSIFLGFLPLYPFAAVLACSLSLIASHTKAVYAEIAFADNRDWPGLGGRPERALLLVGGMLVSLFLPSISVFFTMELFLYALSFMVLMGNIQRVHFALRMLSN